MDKYCKGCKYHTFAYQGVYDKKKLNFCILRNMEMQDCASNELLVVKEALLDEKDFETPKNCPYCLEKVLT